MMIGHVARTHIAVHRHVVVRHRAHLAVGCGPACVHCTHLIVGLPGEEAWHSRESLDIVLDIGTDGLKLHPLHVVKGTQLANEWRRGEYTPLTQAGYIDIAADLIERTPWEIVYHRVTGTSPANLLLAPEWCSHKWTVLNDLTSELQRRGSRQGDRVKA